MRSRAIFLALTCLSLAGCSNNTSSAPAAVLRAYNGTASVGDFLTITLDSTALTISYTDVSNGDTGVVPYTVNADGTYTLNDPEGNLIAAYEVPGYALLIQAAKTGPNHDTPALITAVESGPISEATFAGNAYNFMQFRTAAGGVNIGSVSISTQGAGTTSTYWPYGAVSQNGSSFNSSTLQIGQAQEDPSGTFLTMPDPGGGHDTVFGTANGIFAVDSHNGAILGLQKAATKNLSASFAGTYKAIYYQKTGASTGAGNVETGTPSLDNAVITVTSGGQMTIVDTQGNTVVQATLTPVADAPYLFGSPGELQDPCNGLFTVRIASASSQQDVFVTFMNNALLFSSFQANLPWNSSGTYNYFYGVGLK